MELASIIPKEAKIIINEKLITWKIDSYDKTIKIIRETCFTRKNYKFKINIREKWKKVLEINIWTKENSQLKEPKNIRNRKKEFESLSKLERVRISIAKININEKYKLFIVKV